MRAIALRLVPLLPYLFVGLICFAVLRTFPPLRVTGGSMRPALESGDVVIVNPSWRAAIGDIALFRHPGQGPVLHRVVKVEDGALTTKGDANRSCDVRLLSPDDVQGVVICVIPFGRAVRWWRSM